MAVITPPIRLGDFVWCAFPEREAPLRGGPLHVGYLLRVNASGSGFPGLLAYHHHHHGVAWSLANRRPCVRRGRSGPAAAAGVRHGFAACRLCAGRDHLISPAPRQRCWRAGVLARAPKAMRERINAVMIELFVRRPELVTRLGPLW